MVTIQIPLEGSEHQGNQKYFTFAVHARGIVLAGSRHLELPIILCNNIISTLHSKGFVFIVGCASGVDQSFRIALAKPPYLQNSFVACAFDSRTAPIYSYGLEAEVVVPKNIPAKAALHRRTVWMIRRCQMLVLFPVNPETGKWGPGSTLAFNTALLNVKPVFVVSDSPPPESPLYKLLPGSLFDVVSGFWAVPYPFREGGICEDEF